MFIVNEVWSNNEDGTGSTPRLFEEYEDAIKHFEVLLEKAFYDFISRGYANLGDKKNIDTILSDIEVVTTGTLRYYFDREKMDIDFWNETGFDFGYAIELHSLSADDY